MKNETSLFDDGSSRPLKEKLGRYLSNWPLFLVSLLICMGIGYLYARYTPARYVATTSIFIKGGDDFGGNASADIIEDALNGKRRNNLVNEMMLLNSASLMKRVVTRYGFNTYYYKKGDILDVDIYLDAPFRLITANLTDTSHAIDLTVKNLTAAGATVVYRTGKENKEIKITWNQPFSLNGQSLQLGNTNSRPDPNEYEVRWIPVGTVAAGFVKDLKVETPNKQSTILSLNITEQNLRKATDILNALATEFNQADIEDRSKLAESTVRFIDERLNNISGELQGVESSLENFQGSRQLSDIRTQSSQSLESSNLAANRLRELNVQQGVVTMLLGYFNNPANSTKLVPSSLGIEDPTLASLIANYNDMQLKKEREAPMVAPNSTVMQDINTQLGNLRNSILESLNNISKNLRLQLGSMQQQNSEVKQFLAAVPHNERVLQEIKRKQSITEGLYLYLLQKREEAAISSTGSAVSHYRQIDPATGWGPVSPNTRNILVYTGLLGFFLPLGFIFLRNLFNDKINSREDIITRTGIPVIGDISHLGKKERISMPVMSKGLVSEQFRIIRTNLSFIAGKKQVIMVTSSGMNEGKSFTSLNLASVLAMPGKRVALLEFDLRRPAISQELGLKPEEGLTQYLSGNLSPDDLSIPVSAIPSLHVYAAGPIPPNTGDLLIGDRLRELFDSLTRQYDYIVVDSPPAGLVSDPFILGKYSDIVLFVIRQRFTPKKAIDFLNELDAGGKLVNIGIVFNDVKTGGRFDYYGYGYGQYDYEENRKKSRALFGSNINW